MNEAEWRFKFANRLALIIMSTGQTYREFAEEIGVKEASLNHYVSGRRTPNVLILIKMADALRCSVDELIRF